MAPDSATTLADLVSPKVRRAVYAALAPLNVLLAAVTLTSDSPEFYAVALAVVNSLGFTVARANTTKS